MELRNPNAFPGTDIQGQNSIGMSLRDYFAAQVISGSFGQSCSEDPCWHEVLAKRAYSIADAMLKERDK